MSQVFGSSVDLEWKILSLATSSETPCKYWAGNPFIRTGLTLRNRKFKKTLGILLWDLHGIIYSCHRFVWCTITMQICHFTTSQMCFVGLRSGDWWGHWVQQPHYHVQETSHPPESTYQKVGVLKVAIKRWTSWQQLNWNTKVCQENPPCNATWPLPGWAIDVRLNGSMLSWCLNYILTQSH